MSVLSFTKTLLANILRKPVTRPFPIKIRPPFERTRGSIDITIEDCIYCGQCQRKCPSQAIVVSRNDKFWQINRMRCIQCNACVECCPKKCLAMATSQSAPAAAARIERYEPAATPVPTDA
jgi:ech hydrogenase subunit F